MATAEQRIDGCVAYTSLVRYDAMGELSGQQSSTMALLDARRTGVVVSSILHRDQARVYVKQVREGESELELSPEEQQAIEAAMAGAPARRLMRVGYLGPAGTYSEEALRASAPRRGRGGPLPDDLRRRHGRAGRRGRPRASCRSRTRSRARVAVTLDTLALDATDVRIVAEVVHPIHHCVVAARELDLAEVERVVSHPQATAQCAPLPARAARRTRSAWWRRRPPTRCCRCASRASASVALGSRLAAELYGCRILAADVEDHPDNATRFVWLAPAPTRRAGGSGGKTSIVFWGGGDQSPGWLVRRAARARGPRA